jgi:hypothetical protein
MTTHRIRRRSPGTGPRRQWLNTAIPVLGRVWWVATVAVLAVGATVRYDLDERVDLGPLVPAAEVAAGGESDYTAVESDFSAYPNTSYAGMELAVIDARIVPRYQTGSPIAIVELGVRNLNDRQARLPAKMVRLVGPNGTHIPLDRFEYTDFSNRIVVEPGETARSLAVFQLATGASVGVGDYQLQVAENGRWPATVPLSSTASFPANPYPQPLEALASPSSDGPIRFGDLDIELVEASQALEFGAYRASVGQHLAVVTVEVTGLPVDVGPALDRQLWTLVDSKLGPSRNIVSQRQNRAVRLASEVIPEPERVSTASTGTVYPTTVRLQLVFSYSTESSRLSLRVGGTADGQSVAEFEVQAVN